MNQDITAVVKDGAATARGVEFSDIDSVVVLKADSEFSIEQTELGGSRVFFNEEDVIDELTPNNNYRNAYHSDEYDFVYNFDMVSIVE